MNKYLEKIAKSKWKLMEGIVKSIPQIPSAILPKNTFSKSFTKNVDAIINSRAGHPEMARPYANFISLAGRPTSNNVIMHRINHFREIPLNEAGW